MYFVLSVNASDAGILLRAAWGTELRLPSTVWVFFLLSCKHLACTEHEAFSRDFLRKKALVHADRLAAKHPDESNPCSRRPRVLSERDTTMPVVASEDEQARLREEIDGLLQELALSEKLRMVAAIHTSEGRSQPVSPSPSRSPHGKTATVRLVEVQALAERALTGLRQQRGQAHTCAAREREAAAAITQADQLRHEMDALRFQLVEERAHRQEDAATAQELKRRCEAAEGKLECQQVVLTEQHEDAISGLVRQHEESRAQLMLQQASLASQHSSALAASCEQLEAEQERQALQQAEAKQLHEDVVANMRSEIEAARADHGRQRNCLVRVHATSLGQLRQEQDVACMALRRQCESLTHAHDAVLAQLREEYAAGKEEQARREDELAELHRLAMSEQHQQHEARVTELAQEHAAAAEVLHEHHEVAAAAQQVRETAGVEQHAEEIAALLELHEATTSELSAIVDERTVQLEDLMAQNTEVSQARALSEKQIEEQSRAHMLELEQLCQENMVEVRLLRNNHDKDLAGARMASEEQLENMRREHAERLKSSAAEAAAARREGEAAICSMQAEHSEATAVHRASLQQISMEGEVRIDELKREHAERLKSSAAEAAAARREGEAAICSMQAEHSEATAVHRASLQQISMEGEVRIDELKREHAERLKSSAAEAAAARREGEAAICSMQAEHSEATAVHRASLQQISMEGEVRIDELKREHAERLKSSAAEAAAARREGEAAICSMQAEHSEATAVHRASLQQISMVLEEATLQGKTAVLQAEERTASAVAAAKDYKIVIRSQETELCQGRLALKCAALRLWMAHTEARVTLQRLTGASRTRRLRGGSACLLAASHGAPGGTKHCARTLRGVVAWFCSVGLRSDVVHAWREEVATRQERQGQNMRCQRKRARFLTRMAMEAWTWRVALRHCQQCAWERAVRHSAWAAHSAAWATSRALLLGWCSWQRLETARQLRAHSQRQKRRHTMAAFLVWAEEAVLGPSCLPLAFHLLSARMGWRRASQCVARARGVASLHAAATGGVPQRERNEEEAAFSPAEVVERLGGTAAGTAQLSSTLDGDMAASRLAAVAWADADGIVGGLGPLVAPAKRETFSRRCALCPAGALQGAASPQIQDTRSYFAVTESEVSA
ncbi:hypothetical protein CYMTET_22546 [Cymbomonas tetramitiformis]|uniref:Uncharacterized protein n=1 Tax=Cymbomonas tetramitiformis TaxID=36881 RepID=A0AAE0L207_9CHLO|nr:hypothetical protein CYMTET_22546 [Cymbomonas tetramitiformis]